MIKGLHAILYSADAEADRAFFRDVLGWPFVDARDGWLIFAAPPAELALHPVEGSQRHEFYLMCDDVTATVAELERQGVELARPLSDQGFGRIGYITLPGGSELGIYEPRHASPLAF
ncbi:MAG: VOC family protein [Candidatus Dormibacteraeota bacterium]|nr:VOC family protein [Candidatus Dormibacteraeota bacterium]